MMTTNLKYEEWLTTIANTRLLFNTMDELENMLDNHSIHSNGMKRCYATHQKLRSAFRDLQGEVDEWTSGNFVLEDVLEIYKTTWTFYHNFLHRKKNPEAIALELLSFCYPPYKQEGIGEKRVNIYKQIILQNINIPFLLLLLLKIIPGYDSKEGDATDMPRQYESAINLLEAFVGFRANINLSPTFAKAREEKNKSRIMLVFHVSQILFTYESYATANNLYELANDIKRNRLNIDLAGFWNECDGKPLYTNFWQIENALDEGSFFATHWHKDAENTLTGIRHTLFCVEDSCGSVIFYLLHPESIKHRMKGLPNRDADHVWYKVPSIKEQKPNDLNMQRILLSNVWPQYLHITRCTDSKIIEQYEHWLNDCIIIKPHEHWEYRFTPNIYALTPTYIYIPTEKEGEYYKVPKSSFDGFNRIQLGDNVGTMTMNGKTYLVFDEFLLYISTSEADLKKYGIERVTSIE